MLAGVILVRYLIIPLLIILKVAHMESSGMDSCVGFTVIRNRDSYMYLI